MSELGRKLVADDNREMTRLAEMGEALPGAHGVWGFLLLLAIRVRLVLEFQDWHSSFTLV